MKVIEEGKRSNCSSENSESTCSQKNATSYHAHPCCYVRQREWCSEMYTKVKRTRSAVTVAAKPRRGKPNCTLDKYSSIFLSPSLSTAWYLFTQKNSKKQVPKQSANIHRNLFFSKHNLLLRVVLMIIKLWDVMGKSVHTYLIYIFSKTNFFTFLLWLLIVSLSQKKKQEKRREREEEK